MHLVKGINIEYSEVNFSGNTFYTANVTSYSKRKIEAFKKRAKYPIILPTDNRIKRLKYQVTANTIFKIFEDKPINIALFDKECRIIHLLPRLLSKSRSVYVYTLYPDIYEKENSRIFSAIGASAVISDSPVLPRDIAAVITSENLQFTGIPTFGEHGYFAENVPLVFKNHSLLTLPEYCDIYTVLLGLLEYGKIKSIGEATSEKLRRNNIIFNIKNLP